ncbi:pentapeptide repeat-containing protein [Deferrisoma palaeochoriense]
MRTAPDAAQHPWSLPPEQLGPLTARWLLADETGTSARDRVLKRLRSSQRSIWTESGEERDLRGIRLAGEDLSGLDLAGHDFSHADLSGANLSGATLNGASFVGADLSKANLEGAELLGADLRGAHLNGCRARRAGFGETDAEEAIFFGADLELATFTRAGLHNADFRAAKASGARFREAELLGADFSGADLRGADFALADVSGATFTGADLRNARMRGLKGFRSATWIGVDVRDVDFTGAYLFRRHVLDENYLYEFRRQSRWHEFLYRLWWLTSDCGRSLWRWGLWNLGLALVFGCLYLLVGIDPGDHPTVFTPFYYSIVTLTTLGYGDVVPATAAAQVLAVIEVILGYLGLGGLLSILANKMARRAD